MVLEKQMTVIMSLHELDLAQKISDQVICVHGDHIENTVHRRRFLPLIIFESFMELPGEVITRNLAAWKWNRRQENLGCL